MASTKEVVADIGELVDSVDDLLKTDVIQELPNIARELKATAQLNQAIDLLNQLIQQIKDFLLMLRDPVSQLSALSGILGLLKPFVMTVKRLASGSGQQLAEWGLVAAESITGPVANAAEFGNSLLTSGQAVLDDLPDKDDVNRLIGNFTEFNQTLLDLKVSEAVADQQVAVEAAI